MACKCFTCTHKDPRLKKAYCIGYMEACEWFLNWAKEQGIKMGSISDNDLGGIYAQINCNYQETGCYARDLPDIDEVPRKTTDKIEKLLEQKLTIGKTKYEYPTNAMLIDKINEIIDWINKVDAVNELKGAKNE